MNEEEIQSRLREAEPVRFETGFADRVMARIDDDALAPTLALTDALRRRFVRLAPAALAASIALSAWSLGSADSGESRTALQVLLGIPEVTLEDAYPLTVSAALMAGGDTP